MTRIADRTVLFADLRGSTALFETLGNAEATSVVTHTHQRPGPAVAEHRRPCRQDPGRRLDGGLREPAPAVQAALQMHEVLEALVLRAASGAPRPGLRGLRLQVALARGEVVEMGGDCFGDAVNVAARLIDHAGDNETLVTVEVLRRPAGDHASRAFAAWTGWCCAAAPSRCRCTCWAAPRRWRSAVTQFGDVLDRRRARRPAPDLAAHRVFDSDSCRWCWAAARRPLLRRRLRVSRSHARVDWHSGSVPAHRPQLQRHLRALQRRRDRHGSGTEPAARQLHPARQRHQIGLGACSPTIDPLLACVRFEVLSFTDTVPKRLTSSPDGRPEAPARRACAADPRAPGLAGPRFPLCTIARPWMTRAGRFDWTKPEPVLPRRPPRQSRPQRTGVLLVNLGTPDEPTAPHCAATWPNFLSDPRVVEIPRLAVVPILHGIILRTRPAKSAAKYASDLDARRLAAGALDLSATGCKRWPTLAERGHACWCATPCATAIRRWAGDG
jgi:adenylate cyclase